MAESKMMELQAAIIKLGDKMACQSDWICFRSEPELGESVFESMREDNKVSESKMAVSESKMAEFKMTVIIKLSQNEWVKFYLCKMAESKIAIIKLW